MGAAAISTKNQLPGIASANLGAPVAQSASCRSGGRQVPHQNEFVHSNVTGPCIAASNFYAGFLEAVKHGMASQRAENREIAILMRRAGWKLSTGGRAIAGNFP